MPISKLKINSSDRAEGEPLVDLELDLTPEELGDAYIMGQHLMEEAKRFIYNSPLARFVHIKIRTVEPTGGESIEEIEDPGQNGGP